MKKTDFRRTKANIRLKLGGVVECINTGIYALHAVLLALYRISVGKISDAKAFYTNVAIVVIVAFLAMLIVSTGFEYLKRKLFEALDEEEAEEMKNATALKIPDFVTEK